MVLLAHAAIVAGIAIVLLGGWPITLLLILIGQPAGVGFLITAKSILRFGDVRETSQRKMTEYIIIGTFMSFGWGLLIAVLTRIAFQHWLPATPA
jgi:hypothetical protein